MTQVGPTPFTVTSEDILLYDWQSKIDQHPCKECSSYFEMLGEISREYEVKGDDLGRRVFALLSAVASFYPNYDVKGNPYGPIRRDVDGKRSWMAEDLADEDLNALKGILEAIIDPEFRSRVGDVLWECKRDYKAAQIAVHAYLESAELHKTDDLWPPYADRLERAAQLAAKLGFGKPLHQQVIAVVETAINNFESNLKAGLLCKRLMTIALSHDALDLIRYATLSTRLARDFETLGNWDFSEHYWQLAESWYQKAKSLDDAQRCQLAAAECLVSKAEKSLRDKQFGFGYAAHWMGRGVDALRRAKADPVRVKEVHLRFLALERESLSEMGTINLDIDAITGFRECEEKVQNAAKTHVKGYTFERAVTRLVHITGPTDTNVMRQQVGRRYEGVIWDKIVGSIALDRAGKVADKLPAVGLSTPDLETEAMRKKMVLNARQFNWPMEVTWKIEPARIEILMEHGIRLRDLFWLVEGNPFILQRHERIYLRGLQAGFFGDWLLAMHLLIPQIEASLRHVLQQHGVVTSTLESDGTQLERDVNQLLWMPELESILGPDIIFDLRGILIDRFGHNLRNEYAHGLMPEEAFYQPASVYLWWLVLRLCWFGYKLTWTEEEDAPTNALRHDS